MADATAYGYRVSPEDTLQVGGSCPVDLRSRLCRGSVRSSARLTRAAERGSAEISVEASRRSPFARLPHRCASKAFLTVR